MTSSAKPLARAKRRPCGVERGAAAVEDEIVVASHLVHENQRQTMFLRHVAQHVLPQKLLAHGKGRSRQIDDRLRAMGGQRLDGIVMIARALPEVAVVPDVFANADAQPPAA